MGKYSRDLSEDLVKKVKQMAVEKGLKANGINVEVVRVNKCKTYGEVLKGNEIVKLFLDEDALVVVALYEELFDMVDEPTQNYFIDALLDQVGYDEEKEKVILMKPEINISLSMLHKYKGVAAEKEEAAIYACQQIEEKKKIEKDLAKANKSKKKSEN